MQTVQSPRDSSPTTQKFKNWAQREVGNQWPFQEHDGFTRENDGFTRENDGFTKENYAFTKENDDFHQAKC